MFDFNTLIIFAVLCSLTEQSKLNLLYSYRKNIPTFWKVLIFPDIYCNLWTEEPLASTNTRSCPLMQRERML
jgi:hypothetical protein